MEGSVLVYDSPAEKTYADTSCFRIVKDEHGGNLYEVAYITNYTAVQSNGAKKIVYIQHTIVRGRNRGFAIYSTTMNLAN